MKDLEDLEGFLCSPFGQIFVLCWFVTSKKKKKGNKIETKKKREGRIGWQNATREKKKREGTELWEGNF